MIYIKIKKKEITIIGTEFFFSNAIIDKFWLEVK